MTESKKNLVATAYEELYRRIVTLEYEPGRHLHEQELMDDLGIGRTPIREALRSLAADMLINCEPKKGVVVRPITLQDTKAAFSALMLFELDVARLAVRNQTGAAMQQMRETNQYMQQAINDQDIYGLVEANSDFHSAFAKCSDNVYLIEAYRKVRCESNRLAYLSFTRNIHSQKSLAAHYQRVIGQHDQIIALLEQRNLKELQDCLLQHVAEFKKRIIKYLAG